jgi:hypothetical protein
MRIDIKGTSTTVLGELLTHEVKKHGATLDSIGGPGLPGLSKAIPCIVSTISINAVTFCQPACGAHHSTSSQIFVVARFDEMRIKAER